MEVMYDPISGPCLVEVGSRCHGGEGTWLPVVEECLGYSQLDATLSCYLRPDRFVHMISVFSYFNIFISSYFDIFVFSYFVVFVRTLAYFPCHFLLLLLSHYFSFPSLSSFLLLFPSLSPLISLLDCLSSLPHIIFPIPLIPHIIFLTPHSSPHTIFLPFTTGSRLYPRSPHPWSTDAKRSSWVTSQGHWRTYPALRK